MVKAKITDRTWEGRNCSGTCKITHNMHTNTQIYANTKTNQNYQCYTMYIDPTMSSVILYIAMNTILFSDCSSEDWICRENSCYKLSDGLTDRPTCGRACLVHGANLASIENRCENEFLKTL